MDGSISRLTRRRYILDRVEIGDQPNVLFSGVDAIEPKLDQGISSNCQ